MSSSVDSHVVALLNEAHAFASADAGRVLKILAQLHELMVLRNPQQLIPAYGHQISEFQTAKSAAVRKYVVKFGEDMLKKNLSVLPVVAILCNWLSKDKAGDVQKRAITCTTNTIFPRLATYCSKFHNDEGKLSAVWDNVSEIISTVASVFHSTSNKALLMSAAQHLQNAILLMSKPSAGDTAKVNSKHRGAKSGKQPLRCCVAFLPAKVNAVSLQERADTYLQMLSLRSIDNWQVCLQPLRAIAIARRCKRSQIVRTFCDLAATTMDSKDSATLAQSAKKPTNTALRASLRTNLVQVWKSLVSHDKHSQHDEKMIIEALRAVGTTDDKLDNYRTSVQQLRRRTSVAFVNATPKRPQPAVTAPSTHRQKRPNSEGHEPPVKRHAIVTRKTWQSDNIIDMSDVERLPVPLLTELVLANLKNVPSHGPPLADASSSSHTKAAARSDMQSATTPAPGISSAALNMMRKMGYRDGQGLGARSDGDTKTVAQSLNEQLGSSMDGVSKMGIGFHQRETATKPVTKVRSRRPLPAAPIASTKFFNSMRAILLRRVLERGRMHSLRQFAQIDKQYVEKWAQLVSRLGWIQRDLNSLSLIMTFCERGLAEGTTSMTKSVSDTDTSATYFDKDWYTGCVVSLLKRTLCVASLTRAPASSGWDYKTLMINTSKLMARSHNTQLHHLSYFVRGLPVLSVEAVRVILGSVESKIQQPESTANPHVNIVEETIVSRIKKLWSLIFESHTAQHRRRIRGVCLGCVAQAFGSNRPELQAAAISWLGTTLRTSVEAFSCEGPFHKDGPGASGELEVTSQVFENDNHDFVPVVIRIARKCLEDLAIDGQDKGLATLSNTTDASSEARSPKNDVCEALGETLDLKLSRFKISAVLLMCLPDAYGAAHLMDIVVAVGRARKDVRAQMISSSIWSFEYDISLLKECVELALQNCHSGSGGFKDAKHFASGLVIIWTIWRQHVERVSSDLSVVSTARDQCVADAKWLFHNVDAFLGECRQHSLADISEKSFTGTAFLVPVTRMMSKVQRLAIIPAVLQHTVSVDLGGVDGASKFLKTVSVQSLTHCHRFIGELLQSNLSADAVSTCHCGTERATQKSSLASQEQQPISPQEEIEAAQSNSVSPIELLSYLHTLGIEPVALKCCLLHATKLWPSKAQPGHLSFFGCDCIPSLTISDLDLMNVLRQVCAQSNPISFYTLWTMYQAVQVYPTSATPVVAALLRDLFARKFWSVAEYGRDLWRGFTQLVVLSYKLQRQSILLPVVLELPLPKVVELIQATASAVPSLRLDLSKLVQNSDDQLRNRLAPITEMYERITAK